MEGHRRNPQGTWGEQGEATRWQLWWAQHTHTLHALTTERGYHPDPLSAVPASLLPPPQADSVWMDPVHPTHNLRVPQDQSVSLPLQKSVHGTFQHPTRTRWTLSTAPLCLLIRTLEGGRTQASKGGRTRAWACLGYTQCLTRTASQPVPLLPGCNG